MDDQAERAAYLIAGYIRKTLTPAEHDELDAWVEQSDENMRMFEELTDENTVRSNLEWMNAVDTEQALDGLKQRLRFSSPATVGKKKTLWYAAAASLLIIAVAVYLFSPAPSSRPAAGITTQPLQPILPAAAQVTLTLGDGTVVAIDDEKAWSANESGVTVKNAEGLIEYRAGNEALPHNTMNTLTTSHGSVYQLKLSDGTRVWLNAKSKLSYPVAFNENERVVALNGEAYFEVAKGKTPFKVSVAEGTDIVVLGTAFNVNNYDDAAPQAVTLIEGKVEIRTATRSKSMSPGQTAIISGENTRLQKADTEAVLAWRNNLFIFRDADMPTIMENVARWYDIQVVYNNKPVNLFNATISRGEPLAKLLRLLEMTGKVKFKTENRTVYVL
jgi:ferric-dicitrate binding protein FerR (iron transport regulator)